VSGRKTHGRDGRGTHGQGARATAQGASGGIDQQHQDRPDLDRWLWLLAAGHVVLYVLVAPAAGTIGIHWGNRFLLEVYPLLAILAVRVMARWWQAAGMGAGKTLGGRPLALGVAAVAAVVACSLLIQVYSVYLMRQRKQWSWALNAAVAAHPEPAVVMLGSDQTVFVPQELHANFFQKQLFLVSEERWLPRLEQRLRSVGQQRYLLVVKKEDPLHLAPGEPADDPLGFYSVKLFSRELPP
jgi:hypothetical protein